MLPCKTALSDRLLLAHPRAPPLSLARLLPAILGCQGQGPCGVRCHTPGGGQEDAEEDAQVDVLRTDAHTHRDCDHCYLYCAALEKLRVDGYEQHASEGIHCCFAC